MAAECLVVRAPARLNTLSVVLRSNERGRLVGKDHVQDHASRKSGVIGCAGALWRRRQPHARGDVVLNLRAFDAVEGDELVSADQNRLETEYAGLGCRYARARCSSPANAHVGEGRRLLAIPAVVRADANVKARTITACGYDWEPFLCKSGRGS